MHPKTRVPVLTLDDTPLMPTEYRRACAWVEAGKAEWVSNDLNIKAVRLLREPSGRDTQPIALGVDPGKHFTGVGVQSAKATLLTLHLCLPFERVKARKAAQRILRRARRGRRINRKVPFHLRAHRQKRFNNRRKKGLPPSVRANAEMEQRVIQEVMRLFPVSVVIWEMVKADIDLTSGRRKARSGKGFSPVMLKQAMMLRWLQQFTPIQERHGWETANLRNYLGLVKSHEKKEQSPRSHAVDGVTLACFGFLNYDAVIQGREYGKQWVGEVKLTSCPFRVITRPQLYRRQLHFENFGKGSIRKRKGGTITPFGFRSGDFVQARKAGRFYRGWIGGFSEVNKVVSVYDHNWKRIGQFKANKVNLIKRSTKLCVA